MTRLGFVLTAILGLTSLIALPPVAAQTGESGVTGAAEGIFSRGATFNGVQMSRLTAAQGIVIAADGSATGQFQAALMGTSLLGIPQQVIVEGEVQNGSVGADGTATVSGVATVNMGDGTPALLGVPFMVKTSTLNLGLTLGTNALPTAALTAGSVTIE